MLEIESHACSMLGQKLRAQDIDQIATTEELCRKVRCWPPEKTSQMS